MFSAAAYLDKHGPPERYNVIQHSPKIRVPLFVLSGSLETHTRLLDVPQDMIIAAVNRPARRVPGAGGRESLADQHDARGRRGGARLVGIAVRRGRIGGGC